jgi:hypothetical protein
VCSVAPRPHAQPGVREAELAGEVRELADRIRDHIRIWLR